MLDNTLIQDLTDCYYKILRESNHKLRRFDICKIIAKSPAPRFYISPSYAQRVIRDITIGKPRAKCYRMSEEHQELYRRWQSLPIKNDNTLQELLNSPAPSFYLSAHRIYRLLYKYYDRNK